jgi:hypothetical protein
LVDGFDNHLQTHWIHGPGVVGGAHGSLEAAVEDERVDAVRVHRREQRRDARAVRDAHQRRVVEIHGVHHRAYVVGTLLERRRP